MERDGQVSSKIARGIIMKGFEQKPQYFVNFNQQVHSQGVDLSKVCVSAMLSIGLGYLLNQIK